MEMVQFESLFPGSVVEKMKFSELVSDSNLYTVPKLHMFSNLIHEASMIRVGGRGGGWSQCYVISNSPQENFSTLKPTNTETM
jgi:hypothetical protein